MWTVAAGAAYIGGGKAQRWRLRPVHPYDLIGYEVGHKYIAFGIDCYAERRGSAQHDRLATAAGATAWNFDNVVVCQIRDENIACCINGDRFRLSPSLAYLDLTTAAGASQRNFHNQGEAKIGDKQISRGIHRKADRIRSGPWAAID